jgi:hypothetical protein
LEPLKNELKGKLEPLPNKQDKKKIDPFEDLDFDDIKGKQKKDTKKEDKKEDKKESKKKDADDFDFEFEDIDPDEGSNTPPNGNKIIKETANVVKDKVPPVVTSAAKGLDKDPKKKDLAIEIPNQEAGSSKPDNNEKEEDEYIIIDGKRFREIQIEGEEDEFLMDDDGNIYDKEGVYIGTAKDGGEEEEEEDENPDK